MNERRELVGESLIRVPANVPLKLTVRRYGIVAPPAPLLLDAARSLAWTR